jgi:hypothetical protein
VRNITNLLSTLPPRLHRGFSAQIEPITPRVFVDFSIVRNSFGGITNLRADFNNDGLISSVDFNLLRGNFGQGEAPPLVVDRGKR